VDDPIADAIVAGSNYERLRARETGYFTQSVDRKMRWQSYLLFGLAALLPVTALMPRQVRYQYLTDGAAAAPKVAVLALLASVLLFVTGIGHGLVGLRCARLHSSLSESEARTLLTLERLCSVLGFATGGVVTLATYLLVSVGLGGVETLDAYVAVVGENPFAQSPVGVDVATTSAFALVGAVLLQWAATAVSVERRRVRSTPTEG
jgi:hypothetical protein